MILERAPTVQVIEDLDGRVVNRGGHGRSENLRRLSNQILVELSSVYSVTAEICL